MFSPDRQLTVRQYVHLHNRAGYGLRPGELPEGTLPTRREAVRSLMDVGTVEAVTLQDFDERRGALYRLRADWMRRMSRPGQQALLERMTMFWHDHFACLPIRADIACDQLNLLRREALGNFRDLLLGMATDTAMMRYLNANAIKKEAPNENFAREILELFTVGIESYTEDDVRALARSLAGWGLNGQEKWILRKGQVDAGAKTIFGKTAAFTGMEALGFVATRRTSADYLTYKLWVYLTDAEPAPALHAALSATLYEADFEIRPWLERLLTSDAFYDESVIGARVKSPTDLLVMWTRHVGADLPADNDRWVNFPRFAGQLVFAPPSVAGWPGGRAWVNSSTLPSRMALPVASYETAAEDARALETFDGLAGYAREAIERSRRDPTLARRLLNVDLRDADPISLATHSRYQYA